MFRFLIAGFALVMAAGLNTPAAQAQSAADMPARPAPFRFVNDQAGLMQPADAKQLESGLRRYADNTGTQVVVVTMPSLGGRDVADYGRALGQAWGVGQRAKNNGVVVLIGAQEHQVTIQPGSGLAGTITPAVTSQVIAQMTPSFKQGNYFAGLRTGLNTLMLTANPDSRPQQNQAAGSASAPMADGNTPHSEAVKDNLATENQRPMAANDPVMAPPAPEPSSGPGMGTLLIGALVVGGGLWLLRRMFRSRNASPAAGYPYQPNQPSNTPNFLPSRPSGPVGGPQGNPGGNYGAPQNGGGGMGMGGMLATGAAAAAGAYLGNRMASGHDTSSNNLNPGGPTPPNFMPGTAAGTGAASDYFSGRDSSADSPAPDYFSADNAAGSSSSDYFSPDDNSSSYDDSSSGDSGGGGFDGDSGSSGSW